MRPVGDDGIEAFQTQMPAIGQPPAGFIRQSWILTLTELLPVTQFLLDYGLFLAKTITTVIALLIVAGSLLSLVRTAREHTHERLEIKSVNERFEHMAEILNLALLDEAERKRQAKARKSEDKARSKARKHGQSPRPRLFTFAFDGDISATEVDTLREQISALLQVVRQDDEVLLRLESAGGLVHAYGLAASQLARIRDRRIKLTIAVDKVAASGGYLMACVADKIIAAPFAVIGSIGVVAQMPNFNRLLKKHEVDFELHTAGQFKRTLTLFGENTDEARAKFREELEDTHALFKSFVSDNRPGMDIEKIGTGEHWYGRRAVALRLVDEIKTSDDYLLERSKDSDIYEISYRRRRSLSERFAQGLVKTGLAMRAGIENAWPRAI